MSSSSKQRLHRLDFHLRPTPAPELDDRGSFSHIYTGVDGDDRDPEGSLRAEPTVPAMDPAGASTVGITPAEAEHMRQFGYVVKRGLIPAAELAPFVELLWRQPPALVAGLSPSKPASWVAPGEQWPADNRYGLEAHFQDLSVPWLARRPHTCGRGSNTWKWHGIGHDQMFVDQTSAHPNVLHVVEALLGGPIRRPTRNRGIYSVFPAKQHDTAEAAAAPPPPPPSLGPHTDTPLDVTVSDLMMVVNVQAVAPRSGGFSIWPGSPQLLRPLWRDDIADFPKRPEHAEMKQHIRPVEFCGEAGDALFCHGLMVHSAGIQESGAVRMAVIAVKRPTICHESHKFHECR